MKSRLSPARTLRDLRGHTLSCRRVFRCATSRRSLLVILIRQRSRERSSTQALELSARLCDIALQQGIGGLRGGPGKPGYWDSLRELAQTRSVAVVWNGNQHNADFLLACEQPLDFLPRDYPDPSVLPKTRLTAEGVIREHFRPSLEPLRELMTDIPAHTRLKRLLVGTPAPLFDSGEVRKRLSKEPLFVEKAAAMGINIGQVEITPPTVRRKLWFVIQTMMAEIAEEGRWQFVPVAPETMDERGYLRSDLLADDVTHANIEFGSMMVRQIAIFLQR